MSTAPESGDNQPDLASQADAAPQPDVAQQSAAVAPEATSAGSQLPPPAAGYGYAPSGAEIPVFANGKPRVDAFGNPVSDKSRLAAALLCWFLGVFGIHRFYVGKVGTGILMIFTLGGLGIWTLIDFIMILVGSFKDKQDQPLINW